jgi:AraC-like DNA-binding protein
VVLPYAGAFEWHVGAKSVFLDGTRVLFVGAGEDYADRHVGDCGHDSIIITPRLCLLQERCGHAAPSRHPAFQRVTEPTAPRMNLRIHRLLRLESSGNDQLAGDELMIALLNEAFGPTQSVARASPLRVVGAAKQYLHAHLCEPISLNEIAQALQVSAAYLTDAFTRSEGVPLCRYRMRLRLNRALVDLPRCEDITGLALDLGFSSHAHFSNAFKSLFGVSPSAFRAGCGKPRRAVRMAPGLHPGGAPAHKGGTDLKELKAVLVSARQDGLSGNRRPEARPS